MVKVGLARSWEGGGLSRDQRPMRLQFRHRFNSRKPESQTLENLMPAETFHTLLQLLNTHSIKRSAFLKYFDKFRDESMSCVARVEFNSLEIGVGAATPESFRLIYAGQHIQFEMEWPLAGDKAKAAIAVSKISGTPPSETIHGVLKIVYDKFGLTDQRNAENDEIELSGNEDGLRVLFLHCLRVVSGA